jgi:hypothetical protein
MLKIVYYLISALEPIYLCSAKVIIQNANASPVLGLMKVRRIGLLTVGDEEIFSDSVCALLDYRNVIFADHCV